MLSANGSAHSDRFDSHARASRWATCRFTDDLQAGIEAILKQHEIPQLRCALSGTAIIAFVSDLFLHIHCGNLLKGTRNYFAKEAITRFASPATTLTKKRNLVETGSIDMETPSTRPGSKWPWTSTSYPGSKCIPPAAQVIQRL